MLIAPNKKQHSKSNAQLDRLQTNGEEDRITTTSLPEGEEDEDTFDESVQQQSNQNDQGQSDDLNAALEKMAKLGQETDIAAILRSGVDATTTLLASDTK